MSSRARLAAALVIGLGLAGCHGGSAKTRTAVPGGDPAQGARIIAQVGCGACHVIPGIAGAKGLVGPPLAKVGSRTMIAGVLPNTGADMTRWVQTPQAVIPGNAMPDMGLTEAQARDVAAYLEGLT